MCGIAGMLSFQAAPIQQEQLQAMTEKLAHRGPDGSGTWLHPSAHVGLAHRRLAILDLSEEAQQPFHYLKRYTIVHNGEIYNYIELKKQLQSMGYQFRSASDTEVVVAAFDRYREQCLQYFDGMFAFAIWDEQEEQLFIARDRMGEKPIYHTKHNGVFFIASEMKAFWAAGAPCDPDEQMMLWYLANGTAKNPLNPAQTFYKDIESLPPAHYMVVSKEKQEIKKYWTPLTGEVWSGSFNDAIEQFSELLTISVSRRMRSDVAVGSSMSGGIDSATIVQQMLQQGGQPATFSAIFPGFENDESAYIRQLNEQFHTRHHTIIPSVNDWEKQLHWLMYHQEEPVSSMSVLAQWSVYQSAREQGVTVLLDGQGADEVLAGYEKYLPWYWQELWRHQDFSLLRQERKNTADHGIPVNWGYKNHLAALFPALATKQLQRKKQQACLRLPMVSSEWLETVRWNIDEEKTIEKIATLNDRLLSDQLTGPLEELLRYADRNAMAHGVEVRLPFLQHELVEFLMRLPATFKIKNGYTKYLLRSFQQNRLPEAIVWRKRKVGFEPPQKKWMQETALQELVMASKKWLVDERILQPMVLQQPLAPKSAYAPNNYDWRYVCLSLLLQNAKNR